jgi:hypothetical protein
MKSLAEHLWFEVPGRRGFVNIIGTVEDLVKTSAPVHGFLENCASRPESMSGWISGVVGCADAGFCLTQPVSRTVGQSICNYRWGRIP